MCCSWADTRWIVRAGLLGGCLGLAPTDGYAAVLELPVALQPRAQDGSDGVQTATLVTQQGPQPRRAEPLRPELAAPAGTERVASLFGPSQAGRELLSTRRRERSGRPGSNVVVGSESLTRPSSDAASLLGKSPAATGVGVQKRTPIVTDPRSRGTRTGQLLASGSHWVPARQDLDTMLSKIEASLISDLIAIKGPYSSRYGPGLSFLDAELVGSPRFDGPQWHGRSSLNYQTNGEQWYGRQTILGGSTDWGLRLGYGHRTGSDYADGDGQLLPSSYKSRDVDAAIGVDLAPDRHLEFSYLRLDQTDVEFPGQIFDINFLVTDGFELRYVVEDQCRFDELEFEVWYNRTRFEGDAQRTGKRQQIPQLNCPLPPDPCFSGAPVNANGVLGFIGFTDVDSMSAGYQLAATWGTVECGQLTMGMDLRYVEQELNEFDSFQFDAGGVPIPSAGNFPIPRSHHSNPGIFVEQSAPVHERLTLRAGGRVDWVSANTEGSTRGRSDAFLLDLLGGHSFDRDFVLWSAYVTGEYVVNDCWTATAGAGHAERPPTLTELYAADPFLAILQQGFTFVRGDLELDPERLWQIDIGVRGDYGRFRTGAHAFHAWIHDYITFEAIGNLVNVPDALGVRFTNTDLATLAGAELYGEYDWCEWLTPFASMSYVEGRDHSRTGRGVIAGSGEEPLPGIYPLESRLGVRLHEPAERPRWAIEFAARVVDDQDRVASSLLERATPGFTIWDLRGYCRVTESLLVVAGVENISDKDYREHLDLRTGRGVRQPGVNGYIGFEYIY